MAILLDGSGTPPHKQPRLESTIDKMLTVCPGPFEYWVLGLFPIFFFFLQNLEHWLLCRKKETSEGKKNTSSGDTGRMLFEVRIFFLCVSLTHTHSYTHIQLALWVIFCCDWCQLTLSCQQPLPPTDAVEQCLTSSLPDAGLFLAKTSGFS